MYGQIYDSKHFMWRISIEPDLRTGRIPTGIYEKLLCGECEKKLEIWETYTSQLLLEGAQTQVRRADRAIYISGIHYSKLKLFQLSVLWRSIVSRRKEFAHLNVPSKMENRLREMVLAEDPGEPQEFGCMLIANPYLLETYQNMLFMPMYDSRDGIATCLIVMGGIFWLYSLPSCDQRMVDQECVVTAEGKLTLILEDSVTRSFLHNFALQANAAGNVPREL